MYTVIVIVAVITALLLTFIVLIQESKGGGLASGFAGGNVALGVRKTTDFIEKATWTLAAILVALSVATTYVIPRQDAASDVVVNMKNETSAPVQLPGTQSQQSGAQEQAPAAPQN